MLAAEVAQRISGTDFLKFIDDSLFQPLGMKHSALGLGKFKSAELMACQVKDAAPESGAGDPAAKDWDWNSPYWRKLGAPWGSVHASAPDVARFLAEFLYAEGKAVKPETARLMLRNHNPPELTLRGPRLRQRREQRQSWLLRKDFRPQRLDGDARLGRPRHGDNLRRPHDAPRSCGPASSHETGVRPCRQSYGLIHAPRLLTSSAPRRRTRTTPSWPDRRAGRGRR